MILHPAGYLSGDMPFQAINEEKDLARAVLNQTAQELDEQIHVQSALVNHET